MINEHAGTLEQRTAAGRAEEKAFAALGIRAVIEGKKLVVDLHTMGYSRLADLVREAIEASKESDRLWKVVYSPEVSHATERLTP